MTPEVIAAWIAAIVAILSTAATVILQLWFRHMDQRDKRRHDILQHRKEALLTALQVIDHVYSNTRWNDDAPVNPHKWDVMIARDVMNKLIVYCHDPNNTVSAFSKAIGLCSDAKTVVKYGPADLTRFRQVVCQELELPITNYVSDDLVWIANLPGTK